MNVTKIQNWMLKQSRWIVLFVIGFLAIVVLFFGIGFYSKSKEEKSVLLYLQARDSKDYMKIIKDYPLTSPVPLAIYGLAVLHEQNSQWEEAQKYYQAFLQSYPKHFLVPKTKLALAFVLENKGDIVGAREQYMQLLGAFGVENIFQWEAKKGLERLGQ